MRHQPISSELFVANRARLTAQLLPNSLAIVHANDVLPTNADGSLKIFPNADLFYLSGIEQEESILLLYPDAYEPKHREVLFLREPTERLQIWEGKKLTQEAAVAKSGIQNVRWLSEFPRALRDCMLSADQAYLNQNEHRFANTTVETRDSRFVKQCREDFPLQSFRRLAPLLHQLRTVKSKPELTLIQEAIRITQAGFDRVLEFVKPGVSEFEVEAELAHEFIRQRGAFAYTPIIAAGDNACGLHYTDNDQICRDGELLLLDVGSNYANYNADMTRTIPVNGRFTPRQREVYDAVLRVMNASIEGAVVGKHYRDWNHESQLMMNEELLSLGLLTKEDVAKHTRDEPACRKYFMHGLGHPLGLDVHDVAPEDAPFADGWVITVEPGIYLPEEGFAVRLENDVLITADGPVDLMREIPVEAEHIESVIADAAVTV
ncbi:aminopeptidase P N-terminal domain-containing protein [Blastopirellula retiformator]|uniref:Xaa-Pro aminopeptidase n=1 Tax=Blastopirellula retiformator TaxID=2527970 RepID=A0A5C5V988_9BACT|nr:aminopeptidase P N-terminal domain-containing protein [Blastopirellula retiformator]TWT34427.1 Xaa-Pro aminopeptidase [Blastopirellula retiformator]